MLADLSSTSPESQQAQHNKAEADHLAAKIQELSKDVDPIIGPIQWIVEIENEKRRTHGWRLLALFCIIQLSVIYLIATIFIIKIIISL